MSVDSYDWAHRTGANPPNEPSTVLCNNRPAQPFKYEAVFAHEYQHLLEFWASPGELNWINEGLSDYAITVTGYGFPARSIFETGYEGHIQTFLGWRALQTPANQIPQPKGGAENSLTLWDDQGGLETLADYGASWTFMEFIAGRYGTRFMTDLHNEDGNGITGLQAVLDKYLTGDKAMQVIHDWAAMVALDKAIDDGAKLLGFLRESRYQTKTLNSSIYWENPESYSSPGGSPERLGLRPAPRRRRQAAVVVEGPFDRVLEPGASTRRPRWNGSPSPSPVTRFSPQAPWTTPTARSSAR